MGSLKQSWNTSTVVKVIAIGGIVILISNFGLRPSSAHVLSCSTVTVDGNKSLLAHHEFTRSGASCYSTSLSCVKNFVSDGDGG